MRQTSNSLNFLFAENPPDTAKGFIFGLNIPFLPDFLLDHTLLGKEANERIKEYLRRWNQFVSGLWRSSKDVTYSLRFDFSPNHKHIGTYLLGRLHTTSNNQQGLNQANILLTNLERMFNFFGFEATPLSQKELKELSGNYNFRYCCEVCQEEVNIPIRNDVPITGESDSYKLDFAIPKEFIYKESQRKIYGIRPWWGAGGTFLVPFNALTSQESAVSICILLSPTQLEPSEQQLLAEIARQAESLAQMQSKAMTLGSQQINSSQNKTDPQLRWESRLYAANLRRLSHPFLTTIFCFSNDYDACQQVASAIASTIREEQAYDPPLGESESIASGAKVITFAPPSDSHAYYAYIAKACSILDFTPFLSYEKHLKNHIEKAPHLDLRRLRYLMDGRGAASAFRFPISVEGGVPGIVIKQRPPDFHPGSRDETVPDDAIDLGRFHVGGRAYVSKNSFTKHSLITGFTGSGKSNTSLYLLDQFWRKFQIPFLVIESAKKEYRGLRNVDVFKNQLRIYTLGNETVSPLRFNPFELIPMVRVEKHIALLQTCFEGALPIVGPLPSVIAEALEIVYRQYGWQLTDYARERSEEPRSFPVMQDFYSVVEQVIEERGYQGEVKSNVEAAIKGRMKPLLMGSKGKMFSSQFSYPSAYELFQSPVILELNDLNEYDKSLIMMFFLTLLREYRELHPSKDLTHITLIEEAHNVLANVDTVSNGNESQSDIKAKSVQTFCNMLAEVRAYGEGLIIADQSPEKLARDAMRNTNVQISHQLRDARDREAIASAMIMSKEQQDYLGKCNTGRAALFYSGLEKATFIDVPIYKDPVLHNNDSKLLYENFWQGFSDHLSPHVSDNEVKEYMQQFPTFELEQIDCSLCQYNCQYRDQILQLVELSKEEFGDALREFINADEDQKESEFQNLVKVIIKINNVNNETNLDLVWCYTSNMWMRFENQCLEIKYKHIFLDLINQYLLI
ncbi:ATP-binding protein [Pseudanabaena sp. ABRG5-3]|uniref:ATP-binding protein n=1 Tax=Pseudanabaena sp. ABRG5-3 TaxID=685565 RepID=UPI000DC6F75D|nr:DUF87 domain-containing protein [Pseudanabaena sp. ABRG5-3]BBC22886.1 ATPase [Pseudanabaena sp. ABRG5-3]